VKGNKGVIIGVAIAILLAALLVYWRLALQPSREQITPKVTGAKINLDAKPMTVPIETPVLAARVDVNKAKELRQFVEKNEWLQKTLGSALGRGFSAGWAAFLSSKGEDLKASFKGNIASFLLDQALGDPFSVVWFGGDTASGAPAILIEKASRSAQGALRAMDEFAARGGYTATHCPGDSAPTPKADGKPSEPKIAISRWLVAEHAVYAGTFADRVALAGKPTAVLQALCVKDAEHQRGGSALEVTLRPANLGRETETLGALLGLGEELRFAADLDAAGTLVPKGVSGKLVAADRLGVVQPSDDLLKLLPATAPFAVVLALNLPEKLDAESIAAHVKGEGQGKKVVRQVALVWNPHGSSATTDVAFVWGNTADEKALGAIFSGGNTLVKKKACNHLIFASTEAGAASLDNACKGKTPSRKSAEPAVVGGAQAQQSLALHLHWGALLSGLMLDAYRAEQSKGALPPEINDAKSRLEALPFFGFRGRVEGSVLVPEGFRS
jgi:hypothetical protein